MTERRRGAHLFGMTAETLAAWWLRGKGFRVLERRAKQHVGEIDLIVQRGSLLVFVEVKARARRDDAAFAISPNQQRRIERAALGYLASHPRLAQCRMRFDAVLIGRGAHLGITWPHHIVDAWRPEN